MFAHDGPTYCSAHVAQTQAQEKHERSLHHLECWPTLVFGLSVSVPPHAGIVLRFLHPVCLYCPHYSAHAVQTRATRTQAQGQHKCKFYHFELLPTLALQSFRARPVSPTCSSVVVFCSLYHLKWPCSRIGPTGYKRDLPTPDSWQIDADPMELLVGRPHGRALSKFGQGLLIRTWSN